MKLLSREDLENELIAAIEVHSVERIRAVLEAGLDPRARIRGKPPLDWLLEMYFRSDAFPNCIRLLIDQGAVLSDAVLTLVLLNDSDALASAIRVDPSILDHRTTLTSAFTPLVGASLLHVAAEYGNVEVARVLIEMGADVNATGAVDEYGLNGHTPLFHTVNSNRNRSAPIMRLLLEAGARTEIALHGITWGKGFEWETTLFDVTPISYAQFGLLPQVHREERDIYENVMVLLEASGRITPPLQNVPNRYLSRESPA